MKESNQQIVYLISCTILLILCFVVSFRRKNANRYAGFFLAAYFWSFFLAATITYIVFSPFIEQMPHLFRGANIFFLLIMPFSWLYFRESLHPEKISWKDMAHLIPALLYIIDYFPFFLLPGQEKLNILHSLDNYGVKAGYKEGWFMPAGSHNIIRYIVMLGYWFAQASMLLRAVRLSTAGTGKDFLLQRKWLSWLQFSEPLIFMPALITLILGRIDLMVFMANLFGLIAALIQGFFLLMNPAVLYGIPMEVEIQTKTDTALQEIQNQPGNEQIQKGSVAEIPGYIVNLDEKDLDQIGVALDRVMQDKKLYLDPKLKISDLAIATGFLSYKLSAYFNKRCNQSFNDYINQERVEFCARKLDLEEFRIKTLEALSKESGFHSRSTFIRAFKKFKGKTPSEYVNEKS